MTHIGNDISNQSQMKKGKQTNKQTKELQNQQSYDARSITQVEWHH